MKINYLFILLIFNNKVCYVVDVRAFSVKDVNLGHGFTYLYA